MRPPGFIIHRARFPPPHRQEWWFPMPTMAFADSCPITLYVATQGAVVEYDPTSDRPPRIRTRTVTAQPQHLPYLPNPGLRHVVPTYPETQPCMLFLFPGSSPGQAWLIALRLPSDGPSRFHPCLRLVLVSMLLTWTGFTYRGLSPHKFTPVPGVHNELQPTACGRF
jgi:hypothetical protein